MNSEVSLGPVGHDVVAGCHDDDPGCGGQTRMDGGHQPEGTEMNMTDSLVMHNNNNNNNDNTGQFDLCNAFI